MMNPTYDEMLRRAARAHRQSQYHMDVDVLAHVEVDEVSLVFADEAHLHDFLRHAEHDHAMEHFDSVSRDRMHRLDSAGQFDVRFEFLRMRGCNWRIEAMVVLEGDAPLHREAMKKYGSGFPFHASFKLETEGSYEGFQRGWNTPMSESGKPGYEMFAEYENSYGRFSYWDVPEIGNVWAKPRVNLRD